ncbi:MAG TPA: nucleotidyltransferase family protein [Bradyrhizobium sp.]|jgi:hypothetical protein|nr:nucleotidyltransferase family protein [Bradyrhizobium sp.]
MSEVVVKKPLGSLDAGLRNRAATALFPLLVEIQLCCREKIWLGGGTLRDILVGSAVSIDSDVDLLFFNEREISEHYEADIEAQLTELTRIRKLSVKNQARMGLLVDGVRHENLYQSVAAFPDVTVAAAACVHDIRNRSVLVFAPYGIPSRGRRLIQPTSRYLTAHGLQAYYSWLDRKKYDQRFRDWAIDTAGRVPFGSASAFVSINALN